MNAVRELAANKEAQNHADELKRLFFPKLRFKTDEAIPEAEQLRQFAAIAHTIEPSLFPNLHFQPDSDGMTPLHHVAQTNNFPGAQALLKVPSLRAEIDNRENKHYGTALHVAARSDAREVAAALVDAKADVMARDRTGCTPLHTACFHNSKDVCKVLLASEDIDPEATTRGGATPLHYTAGSNSGACALLLSKVEGINLFPRNALGETPLDIAERLKHRKVASLLTSQQIVLERKEQQKLAKAKSKQAKLEAKKKAKEKAAKAKKKKKKKKKK